MKQKDVTLEFLETGMLENKQEEICLWKEIENELINLIRQVKEQANNKSYADEMDELKEEIRAYQNALDEVRECKDDDSAYDIYQNVLDDYDELIGDLHIKSQEQAKEKYRISELASNYLKIIRNLPDDINFTIDFSTKSPSIYIKTNINATEESTEEFANLGEHGFLVENIYEKNECFEGKIEIRLSDHEFGGYTKFSGYGDYVSYEKECISYVYQF